MQRFLAGRKAPAGPVAGVATYYTTNEHMLKTAEYKLGLLKEDSQKMRAKDLHELPRAPSPSRRCLQPPRLEDNVGVARVGEQRVM
jgi:hypothetical protein